MTVLHTLNLTLRPCHPADGPDFIALERDAEVMQFLNGGPVDHGRVDPDKVTFLMPRGHEPHVWTARRRADEAFVGWFGLFPEGGGLAELGYRLRRDHWGRGLASEGAMALIDWGFGHAGHDRIIACTLAVNHGSRRVMEKTGMTHERTEYPAAPVPVAGSEQGEVWYGLSRDRWASQR
ncbi:GNAT family acetyltransferase [Gemmobacter nanjingensis]|uniref:GNAT family acetyltransferase n=1 Tax=Gemmobacter nanjingensis TaxID=488454 RepID=A0ABQ3FDX1_9RHOB|nr:GNAT family N-acetyltransferase [Gemmobacter nanjingensis]GHC19870.1 GNAT family acetyltransferase [Gemmobacter nanjingensis]